MVYDVTEQIISADKALKAMQDNKMENAEMVMSSSTFKSALRTDILTKKERNDGFAFEDGIGKHVMGQIILIDDSMKFGTIRFVSGG